MGLPDTREVTFIPLVTPFESQVGNKEQDEIVRFHKMFRGDDVTYVSDFDGVIGSNIDATRWNVTGTVKYADDTANGGVGTCAKLDGTGGLAAGLSKSFTCGNFPWRIGWRFRLGNYAGWAAGKSINLGIFSASPPPLFLFQATKGANGDKWGFLVGTSSLVDSGVAVDSAYHFFEVRCDGLGNVTFYMDGTQKYSVVIAGSLGNGVLYSNHNAVDNVFINKAVAWASRLPLAGSSAVASTSGAHVEAGVVFFDGTQDFIDVTFNTDFADANYAMKFSAMVRDGNGNLVINAIPTPSVNEQHGFRLQPVVRFTGKVSWEAYA